MADLTLQQLADAAPEDAITVSGSDVVISLGTLTGESTLSLTDEKVGEALSKLLQAAADAQTEYNQTASAQLNSYPTPTLGTPIADDSGQFFSTKTHTVTIQAPLNLDEITGVTI